MKTSDKAGWLAVAVVGMAVPVISIVVAVVLFRFGHSIFLTLVGIGFLLFAIVRTVNVIQIWRDGMGR